MSGPGSSLGVGAEGAGKGGHMLPHVASPERKAGVQPGPGHKEPKGHREGVPPPLQGRLGSARGRCAGGDVWGGEGSGPCTPGEGRRCFRSDTELSPARLRPPTGMSRGAPLPHHRGLRTRPCRMAPALRARASSSPSCRPFSESALASAVLLPLP